MGDTFHLEGAIIESSMVGGRGNRLVIKKRDTVNRAQKPSRAELIRALDSWIDEYKASNRHTDDDNQLLGIVLSLKSFMDEKDKDESARSFVCRTAEAIGTGLASSAIWELIRAFFGI